MHVEPRNGASIDRVYIHKNEGPEQEGGAAGLAGYIDHIDGGYHKIRDNKVTITKAADDQIVWGEGGDNLHCLSICDVGWSSETAEQYNTDPYSIAEFEGTAQEVAAWCIRYNIPTVHVAAGAPGQAPTARGIAEHADDHDPASEGHTDPGLGYPIDALASRVVELKQPTTSWPSAAELKAAHLARWEQSVIAHPLHYLDNNVNVWIMTNLLFQQGLLAVPGSKYNLHVAAAVHSFKARHKLNPSDGRGFGAYSAAAILGK